MTLTDRDKKIAMALIPLLLIAAVWFLVLAPKRSEASALGEQVSEAESKRDDAVARLGTLRAAKANYAKDYAAVVRLGKAAPSSLDLPSLIVQLDQASKGTGIAFDSIKPGARSEASSSAGAAGSASAPAGGASPSTSSSGSSTPPAAAGGEAAKTGPGQATEKANGAAQTSESAGQASAGSSAAPATPGASTPGATGPTAPGLDSVPLDFTFTGSFFDLADFFHEMKRFVRVANDRIQVKGRLMTLDQVKFDSSTFPKLKADVSATVYLAPKEQGTNAGGTTSGPTGTPAPASTSSPAPASAPATTGGTQ